MPSLREYAAQDLAINEWSLAELHTAYDVTPHATNKHLPRQERARNNGKHHNAWYGGIETDAEARSILVDGWKDGAERLTDIASEITPPVVKTRRRVGTWRNEGAELGIDRALAGQWDSAWRDTRREWSAGSSTVDLIAMFGGSANQDSESMFWNGAAACVITNVLESAGYATSITGCFLHSREYRGEGTLGRTDIIIKGSDETLRIDALASLICHAGIFRTYVFQALLSLPFRLNEGLGPAVYQWQDSHVERMRAAGELSDGAIVLKTCYSQYEATREINRVLTQVAGGAS